jgi:hypothetical protein
LLHFNTSELGIHKTRTRKEFLELISKFSKFANINSTYKTQTQFKRATQVVIAPKERTT